MSDSDEPAFRTCRICLVKKPLHISFPRLGGKICNKCKSSKQSNKLLERRANKRPHKYMECNKCYKIFHMDINGSFYEPPRIKTHCPSCNSTDIEGYVKGER